MLLVEDHLQRLAVHRHLVRHGYRLVKRTGCNNWYVPRETRFPTAALETWALWKEIHLDTPVRCLRFALKRWRARRRERTGRP